MGNNCEKPDAQNEKMTSDERETWHWDNWIRYVPVANIGYGVLRAAVYSCKAAWGWIFTKDDVNNRKNVNFGFGKEITKSIFTAAGGVLAFITSAYLGNFLSSLVGHTVGAQLMKLVGEMIAGQFFQNILTLLGDVATSWKEFKMKTKNEWEEIVNTEAFKIPFIGFLYSVLRSWICDRFGIVGVDESETDRHAVINLFASILGLGAAYGFYVLSCHPSVTQVCHNKHNNNIQCRYSMGYIFLKLCTIPSRPDTWIVPKCCALDEVLHERKLSCVPRSGVLENTPWRPTIYKTPKYPLQKIDDVSTNLVFRLAGLPKSCKTMQIHNNGSQTKTVLLSLETLISTQENSKHDALILSAPLGELDGMIQPFIFNPKSRRWSEPTKGFDFCVENFYTTDADLPAERIYDDDNFVIFYCNEENVNSIDGDSSSFIVDVFFDWVEIIISSLDLAFLALIIAIYTILWKRHKINGMITLCFTLAAFGNELFANVVSSLAMFLTVDQVGRAACYGIAVLAHYFFLSVFMWLTVMNIDMWISLKSIRAVRNGSKKWGRFCVYILIGWISPLGLVAVFVIMNEVYSDPTTEVFVPDYATLFCHVSPYFALQYMDIPLYIICAINFVLIVLTVRIIVTARNERTTTLVGNPTTNANQYSIKLLVKLFVVMGLGFTSVAVLNSLLWHYNQQTRPWPVSLFISVVYLTPIYLFVLFCLKDRVISQLKEDGYPKLAGFLEVTKAKLKRKKGKRQFETLEESTQTLLPSPQPDN